MVVQVVLTIRKFFQHFEFTWAEVIVYHALNDTVSFNVFNDLFRQQPLTAFFSSIWCYWPPWAFSLFLTGNIFQYSRINSIGGNFFSLYIYIKKGNSFLCSSDCLLSDHRSRQKVVRRCHICPRLVMCLLSASTTFDVNRGP